MKIKLNISKDLKRDLKIEASKKDMERNEFIYEVINDLLKEKEGVWLPKIDNILEVVQSDEISSEEKQKRNEKTKGKLQPLILNVDERTYFALAVISKKLKKSKEEMLINILAEITR